MKINHSFKIFININKSYFMYTSNNFFVFIIERIFYNTFQKMNNIKLKDWN